MVKSEAATTPTAVTNPKLTVAVEYSELSEKSLHHPAHFEFDAWADMLADNVLYAFPAGDVDSRTTLKGRAALLAWWKDGKRNQVYSR